MVFMVRAESSIGDHSQERGGLSKEEWEGNGQVPFLLAEQRKGWSLMIFYARATRGRGLPSLDARSGRSVSPHPWKANEQAWREHTYRSMRAVKDSLGHPLKRDIGEGFPGPTMTSRQL